jgi:hypothetical protein
MNDAAQLPPFESVLKSRDVEDPVNLWVHRPLAYAIVALIYRTSITPNQITLVATIVGISAGVCFYFGSPLAMLLGGCLLWSSAILDGADGILARAKRMFSDVGRSLDGGADGVVALATVPVGFYHLWLQHHDPLQLALMPFAIGTAMLHIYLYDYYKEAYMQHTNPAWNGEPERPADIWRRHAKLVAEKAPWPMVLATRVHCDLLQNQMRVVRLTNPAGLRQPLSFPVSDETVRIYRKHNAGPMKIWALISLAPHSYGMAICAMFDRLDVYLWLRVIVANSLFVIALIWQRAATRRGRAELAERGLSARPALVTPAAGAV